MKLTKLFATVLCSTLISLPVAAEQLSTIKGIDAQPLTSSEMDAVHGTLTVTQIRSAMVTAGATADTLRRFDLYIAPRLTGLLQQVTIPQ